MNYFEFYEMPITLKIDAADLKKKFYQKSRALHPDFHTQATAEKQAEILELSALNTEAYKTLSNFDARLHYFLTLKGELTEENKNEMPQDFLMEVMDINEALMELEFDFDEQKFSEVEKQIKGIENELVSDISPLLESYDDTEGTAEQKKKLKIFYLKMRYLLRIQKTLFTFAPQSKESN